MSKILVLWVVKPCTFVDRYQHLTGTCCPFFFSFLQDGSTYLPNHKASHLTRTQSSLYLMITQLFSVLKSLATIITEERSLISMDSTMQIHQFAVTIKKYFCQAQAYKKTKGQKLQNFFPINLQTRNNIKNIEIHKNIKTLGLMQKKKPYT